VIFFFLLDVFFLDDFFKKGLMTVIFFVLDVFLEAGLMTLMFFGFFLARALRNVIGMGILIVLEERIGFVLLFRNVIEIVIMLGEGIGFVLPLRKVIRIVLGEVVLVLPLRNMIFSM